MAKLYGRQEVFLSASWAIFLVGIKQMVVVQTVEHATQLAMEFAKKYYSFIFPVSTKRENTHWIVDLDISYYRPSYARLRIFVETGAVEDFKVTPGQLL